MKGLLISCGVFTLVSCVLAIGEMIYSMYTSYLSPGMTITGMSMPTGLQELLLLAYYFSIKYVGPLAWLPSFYACWKLYRNVHALEHSIATMWNPAALFFLSYFVGESPLLARLVQFFVRVMTLNTDFTETRTEPSIEAVGTAAIFGIPALFFYIGYLLVFMYKRIERYEKQNLPEGTKTPEVIMVYVSA